MLTSAVWQWYQVNRYNTAIEQSNYQEAKKYKGDYGLFASAYLKQKEKDFQEALILYVSLEKTEDKELRKHVLFNEGNTYLQQALTLDEKRDAEQIFPLVELAKVSYRRVLRMDNEYWGAKYNLERALKLLPDSVDKKNVKVIGFSRLVKSIISAANQDELPPRVYLERPSFRYVFVFDISQSMNVMDTEYNGLKRSRLNFAKQVAMESLTNFPCGTEVGFALFSGHRAFLLTEPVETCQNVHDLVNTLKLIDWKTTWKARSEIAKGLYKSIRLMKRIKNDTRVVFFTDGHEAPPVNPDLLPAFSGRKGEIKGVVVGVGGDKLVKIPKIDRSGKQTGFWKADEVVHVDIYTQEKHKREGNKLPSGTEHLSSLRESYLKELSDKTGLFYIKLRNSKSLVNQLKRKELSNPKSRETDIRCAQAQDMPETLLKYDNTDSMNLEYQQAINLREDGQAGLAFPILLQLAEKGYIPAQYDVGKMYSSGLGIEKDETKAFQWVSSAANYGYPEAQNSLGLMYDEGWGVRKNDRNAAHWYYQAANQGLTKAQVNIGMMFCLGEGTKRNKEQCVYWIKKAKDKGSKQANDAWLRFELDKF
ncbi:Sel1-repeat-containing protein YbeQ [Nymphon striatum]|nr:Sel1-repeat-containing protein YbeQ [Nymphon striatum]